jgi:WD40 repeat protein
VTQVAFSPDGKRIASGGIDGTVRLCEATSLGHMAVLPGGDGKVTALAFSPDGNWLVAGGTKLTENFAAPGQYWTVRNGWLALWHCGAETRLRAMLAWANAGVDSIVFAPNGLTLVVGLRFGMDASGNLSTGLVQLWDLRGDALQERGRLEVPLGDFLFQGPSALGCAPGVADLARSHLNAHIAILLQNHPLAAAACSSYSLTIPQRLAWVNSASNVLSLRLWDPSDATPPQRVLPGGHHDGMNVLAFSPDGQMLASAGTDGTIRVWKVTDTGLVAGAVLKGHPDGVTALAFCPDNHLLASGGRDRTIRLWDLRDITAREQAVLRGHREAVTALAFAPDGRSLVSGSDDRALRLWDLSGATPKESLASQARAGLLRSLTFSPDGKTLAVGSEDRTVQFWDLTGSAPREHVRIEGLKDIPRSLAVSPDGKKLAAGKADRTVELWDLRGARPKQWAVLPGQAEAKSLPPDHLPAMPPQQFVLRLQFALDGKVLAAHLFNINWPGTVMIPETYGHVQMWDLTGERPRERIVGLDEKFLAAFALSRDCRLMAAVHGFGVATLWDLSGEKARKAADLISRRDTFGSLTFSLDGRTLGIVLEERTGGEHIEHRPGELSVQLWDLASKKSKGTMVLEGSEGSQWQVELAPHGQTLAVVGTCANRVIIWSAATGRKLREFHLPALIESVALAPDGRHLATLNGNGTVYILRLWDDGASERALLQCDAILRRKPQHAMERSRRHLSAVVAVLLQNQPLAAASCLSYFSIIPGALRQRGQLYLRQDRRGLSSQHFGGELRQIASQPSKLANVAFLSDSCRVLAAAPDGTFQLWDIDTGRQLRTFPKRQPTPLQSVAVAQDGHRILSGGSDHALRLWDVDTGKELRTFAGHTDAVTSAALSADGRRAMSGSADGTARLWDVTEGKTLTVFRGHRARVGCVALSPDGSLAVSGDADGAIHLWDALSGKEWRTWTGHSGGVQRLVFATDGRRLLSGGADSKVRLWDSGTGRELRCFEGHTKAVEAIALSVDGKLVLSGSLDGSVRLWDTATGAALWQFDPADGPVTSVALSPDGRLALSGGEKGMRLWQLPLTWEQAHTDLTAAIRLQPRGADAYFNRARLYIERQEYDQAIADLSQVIALERRNSQAYYQRGLLYAEREQYARAKADLDQAIRLNPELGKEIPNPK